MKDALWLIGFAALPLFGLALWRLRGVAALDLPARIAVAFAGGAVFVSLLMYVYSIAGVRWTRVSIAVPLLAISLLLRPNRGEKRRTQDAGHRTAAALIIIIIIVTIYGIATARETCGDLLYFWGPKAEAFHLAGRIDVAFLGWEHHYLMHPDYPPLLPLLYAWSSIVAHRFSWWGALLTMPLLLLLIAFTLRGFARKTLGDDRAALAAMLTTALLAHGFAVGMVAGAADPMLVFFETLAIVALAFDDSRDAHIVAAIALAGAVFTKVEGASFAVIVVVAYAVSRRRFRPLSTIVIPPLVLLGSWLLFIRHHHLVDQYGRAGGQLHLENLGAVIGGVARQVKYEALYLPWIAVAAPFAIARNWRRAALPLLAAAGTTASAIFFYLHQADPSWWIASSAERVFLTPLMCLAVAGASASE
jgi:hypothetical protein